jgi:hypothetical protein
MADPKLAALIQKLLDKTGQIEWEATAKADVYQSAFPDYSVRIFERDGDIIVQIYDSMNRLIEGVSHEDFREPDGINLMYGPMSRLLEAARRKAMKVD